jgi:predicted Abi (CAAX) family protease
METEKIRATLSDCEWAYLAGLFDGEGSLQIRKGYPRAVIKMNSGAWEELLLKMGIGKLYPKQSKWQEQSAWYLYKREDLLFFLQSILPYSLVKTESIKQVITYILTKKWKRKQRRST